jgi:hypothetical protein
VLVKRRVDMGGRRSWMGMKEKEKTMADGQWRSLRFNPAGVHNFTHT